ncbi:DeoR/GlpR transcriptional regulator [Streptomyces sp. 5-10]|nr:DeoR/GlpR transcriptional regulator [Streptomyces sp. 5-10]
MLPRRRRALLTEFVNDRGQATVAELAEAFSVSADTVRRDLDWLAAQGAIARTYGGAVTLADLASADTVFSARASLNGDAKKAIGQAAADCVADGETVLLNGGTTTLAVARALGARQDLTIVTNNIRVPGEIPASAVRDLYLIGGACRLASNVTIGPIAFPHTAGMSVDVAIIGVGGLSAQAGLSTSNLPEAQMMAEMLHAAHRTIVVVDSSKFGRNAFAHIAGLDAISHLVCDKAPQGDLADALAAAGVRVIVTGAE